LRVSTLLASCALRHLNRRGRLFGTHRSTAGTPTRRRAARSGQARIIRQLREVVYPQLRGHQHFGPNIKKLKDYQPETWWYRIGAWRFFYEIEETRALVFMIAASHRASAY